MHRLGCGVNRYLFHWYLSGQRRSPSLLWRTYLLWKLEWILQLKHDPLGRQIAQEHLHSPIPDSSIGHEYQDDSFYTLIDVEKTYLDLRLSKRHFHHATPSDRNWPHTMKALAVIFMLLFEVEVKLLFPRKMSLQVNHPYDLFTRLLELGLTIFSTLGVRSAWLPFLLLSCLKYFFPEIKRLAFRLKWDRSSGLSS